MIRKPLVKLSQQQLRSRSSVISPLLKEEKPKIQNVCKDIRGVLDEHLEQKSSLLNPISKYYFDGKVRRAFKASFDKIRQFSGLGYTLGRMKSQVRKTGQIQVFYATFSCKLPKYKSFNCCNNENLLHITCPSNMTFSKSAH